MLQKFLSDNLNLSDYVRIFTKDIHNMNDAEISYKPNLYDTFPPHCMSGTLGSRIIDEVNIHSSVGFTIKGVSNEIILDRLNVSSLSFDENLIPTYKINNTHPDIYFEKNTFSIWDSNENFNKIINIYSPENIYVYGVAGDICVKSLVNGLLYSQFYKFYRPNIYIITDCCASINNDEFNKMFTDLRINAITLNTLTEEGE